MNEVLAKHRAYAAARAAKPVSTSALLAPLVELLHDNAKPTLAYDVWVGLFPQVWGRLSPTEQLELVNPLTAILCKEAYLKQAALEPNVVQGWLHALLEWPYWYELAMLKR